MFPDTRISPPYNEHELRKDELRVRTVHETGRVKRQLETMVS